MFKESKRHTKAPVPRTWREGNSQIRVGRFTYGTRHLDIRQWGEGASLEIGSFCSIATAVTVFLGGNHRTDWITTYPFGHVFADQLGGEGIEGHPATRGDVKVGHDVWLGHGCTILSGVAIGNGAVLAANTTVSHNVSPYAVVAGNPGQVVKFRFSEEIIELLQQLAWWDLPEETIRELAPALSQAPSLDALSELLARYR